MFEDLKVSDTLNSPKGAMALKDMMRLLDVFFFGGHLRLVDLHFGEHVFEPQTEAYVKGIRAVIYGCMYPLLGQGGPPRILIKIEALNLQLGRPEYGQPRTLPCIISTLIHEMVHAFFSAFTCFCSSCFPVFMGAGGDIGPIGHGVVFERLLDSIFEVMGGWNDELECLPIIERSRHLV